MRNYDFRRFTLNDIALLRRWLNVAHVKAWWPDLEKQIAQIVEDLDTPHTDMRVVELSHIPFAFISDFDAAASKKPEFADLPKGTRGLATFVGHSDFFGSGHSSEYIQARVRSLRQNSALVAVAPNTTDTRTIAIYRDAGFHPRRMATTADGKLVQVMTHL